jgi:predicted aspartyl protease
VRGFAYGLGLLGTLFLGSLSLLAARPETEVRLRLYRGYAIVAEGSIGSLNKLNFLIDTGAVPSVLDQRIARKLRLVGRWESVSVFSGSLRTQRVDVPHVQLGPVGAAPLSMLVRDLGFIEEELGVRVDAMIGLDLLSQSSFTIDYHQETISFSSPEPCESSVGFIPGLPYPIVEFHAQGQLVRLLVDTGAKDLILFEPRVRGRLPLLRTVGSKTSANMNGPVSLKKVELAEARLGRTDIGSLNAFILDVAADSVPGFDGLLGLASLGARRVSFDFARHTISWEK